jgi:hypothetical protein
MKTERTETAWVRRKTKYVDENYVALTEIYEVVVTDQGWGARGRVVSEHDDKDTALNLCKLINGSANDRQQEEFVFNGRDYGLQK